MAIRLNIYIWRNKFSSHQQYLFGFFFTRNAKKAHADQSILQSFLLYLKKTCHKPLNIAVARISFPSVYYHWQNLLRLMWKLEDIFYTNLSSTSGLVQLSRCCFLWNILRWCRARDLFGSQIPVTIGGFELRISCIRSSYLTH